MSCDTLENHATDSPDVHSSHLPSSLSLHRLRTEVHGCASQRVLLGTRNGSVGHVDQVTFALRCHSTQAGECLLPLDEHLGCSKVNELDRSICIQQDVCVTIAKSAKVGKEAKHGHLTVWLDVAVNYILRM